MKQYPIVAIIGRPNVGKSSLFNAFVGKKKAIVTDVPGTTRDYVDEIIKGKGPIPFQLVDTAGIMELEMQSEKEQHLEEEVQKQVRYAIDQADLVIFIVDVLAPDILSTDREACEILRRSEKPYLFVANKCDNQKKEEQKYAFMEFGLGEPMCLSVTHRLGLKDLIAKIQFQLKDIGFKKSDFDEEEKSEDKMAKIAFIGMPNVGKSALFNALTGEQKVIVSDVAGTTRDAKDTLMKRGENSYLLIDTAGIRKRGKIEKGIESFSVFRTERSIRRADVCMLVLDAPKGISKQDMHVSEYILKEKKGVVIVVNKWDLIKSIEDLPYELQAARLKPTDLMEQYILYLKFKLPFLPWASVIFTSAETGENVEFIYQQVDEIMSTRRERVDTGILNRFVARIIEKHKPTGTKAFMPKIHYVTQASTNPPHFIFFVNDKKFFHFSYTRYLENKIREKYNFQGTPIVIELKTKTKKDYS